jgi:hypothetical protein
MKLTFKLAVRQINGTIEIAYVNELKDTAIKLGREGKYFIEISGNAGTERYDTFDKAAEELRRQNIATDAA